MVKTTETFSLAHTVDPLTEIREILEKIHYTQQLIDEKFFGYRDVKEDKFKQLSIIHEHHRYSVFSSIVSDNLHNAEALLKDLLRTVEITLQDS